MGSGSSTHIANAYSKVVYAKADAERCYVTRASISEDGMSAEIHVDWNKIDAGFSRINPGGYLRYDVDRKGGANTVYISIVTEDGIVVANALPKKHDLSVIVTASAQVADTKYGTIWVDTGDHHH